MPLPKSKLQKKSSGKPPTPLVAVQEPESLDFDQEKFESELCWCIQQLQRALKSGKLNEKQVQDHRKALNVLMSHSTPLVRKRQVMRLSFGDYRTKMKEEDKKFSKVNANIKVHPSKPSSKSQFFKKHIFSKENGDSFKFNFAQTESNSSVIVNEHEIHRNMNDLKIDSNFRFKPSDNGFRFNFNASTIV